MVIILAVVDNGCVRRLNGSELGVGLVLKVVVAVVPIVFLMGVVEKSVVAEKLVVAVPVWCSERVTCSCCL